MSLDVSCLGIESYDAFKVVPLSGGRREFCFLSKGRVSIGTMVRVRATYHSILDWVTEEVSGNRERKEGMWEIYVMVKGKEGKGKNDKGK